MSGWSQRKTNFTPLYWLAGWWALFFLVEGVLILLVQLRVLAPRSEDTFPLVVAVGALSSLAVVALIAWRFLTDSGLWRHYPALCLGCYGLPLYWGVVLLAAFLALLPPDPNLPSPLRGACYYLRDVYATAPRLWTGIGAALTVIDGGLVCWEYLKNHSRG